MTVDADQETKFEAWVTEMPEALERFIAMLPSDVAAKVDFSLESLDAIERWVLSRYSSIEAYRQGAPLEVFDGVPRYVGETIRRNFGGAWDIDLKNRKSADFGLPKLVKVGPNRGPYCPHHLATAMLDRRTGRYLRESISDTD